MIRSLTLITGKAMFSTIIKFIYLLFILQFLRETTIAQSKVEDYEIAAKDAAWCWFSDPRAVYYKGEYEKIYYGYINSKGDVVISSKDLKTKQTKTFLLHKALQIDDHNVPSILFLPDGRLLTFYTEHNGRFFIRKSKNPEDVTSWEEERVIPFGGKRITYSHPVMLSGEKNRIYMFWRGSDWRPSLSFSDDFGETWSESKALIESKGRKNRPYLKVSSDNKNRIDFIFTDGHPSIEPTNSVYHIYYKNGAFYQTNGSYLAPVDELPIEHNRVNKVYNGEIDSVRSWISDISLNKKKQPVIAYTRYPKDSDHRYHYAVWNGKKWLDEEICKAGSWMPISKPGEKIREPHYSGGISLDHNNPSNVYLSREINGIFEIENYIKSKNKWLVKSITVKSVKNNVRPYVVYGYKGNPIVLWMYGLYHHYTKFDTDLLINQNRIIKSKMKGFSGNYNGNAIKLNWKTLSEKNNSHFEVLRSGDGITFSEIDRVRGGLNSDSPINYASTDYNPLEGTNYYMLRQVDNNNDYAESKIIAIKTFLEDKALKIFKKDGMLRGSLYSATSSSVQVSVTDITGRSFYTQNIQVSAGKNHFDIPTHTLHPGVYVVSVQGNGEVQQVKFVN